MWEAEKNTSGDEGSVRVISGEAECEDGTWCHRDSRRERWRGGRGGGFGFRLLLHCVFIRQSGSPQAQRSLMQTCRSAAFVTVASFLLPHVL